MSKVANIVKQSSLIDPTTNDTIRLWEGHREQATLWRAIALLQIPTTLTALIFCLTLWNTRQITLNVPQKPMPGSYVAKDIPDSEFVDVATQYVNLIATYQPAVVRRQFDEARKYIWGQMLEIYDEEMLDKELRAIETTSRTQIFFAEPSKTKIAREGNIVMVSISGDRLKRISKNDLPLSKTTFEVTMKTIPRNTFNPYGIVITNVAVINDDKKKG